MLTVYACRLTLDHTPNHIALTRPFGSRLSVSRSLAQGFQPN